MGTTPTQNVRELGRQETRRRLLKAASELFAQRPASEVKATDITKLAEVSTGSLYAHLGSKHGALKAVLASAAEALSRRIRANWALEPESAQEILEASAHAIVEMFQEDRALAVVYLREGPNHPEFAELLLESQREALRRGQERGLFRKDLKVEPTSQALIGLIRGLMMWWVESGEEDPTEVIALLVSMRADLLLPKPTPHGDAS
ncbi:MAG: TetR/AcrR family transcriptional regulator [Myxococcota bacterium]